MRFLKLLYSLFFAGCILTINHISDVCKTISPTFRTYNNIEHDYNLVENFDNGFYVGNGQFGEVRRAKYGFNNIEYIAIKRIKNENNILPEFDVLLKFAPMNVGPSFFGCQYNSNHVYIAQTLLHKDLASEGAALKYKGLSVSKSIELVYNVVEELATMWRNGFLHNDIKEANVMSDLNMDRLKLIDFGMAQSTGTKLKRQGSPLYMSPNKWIQDRVDPKPQDDLYSVGVMIGVLEEFKGYDELLKFTDQNGYLHRIPDVCFSKFLTFDCQIQIKTNVRRVLAKSNFGNYHRSPALRTKDQINFTTLVALMIGYHDYPFNYDETLEVLSRLIKKFKQIESEGERKYVPPIKDWKYSDADDEPDNYNFEKKYPKVAMNDMSLYESKLKKAIQREESERKVKEKIHEDNQKMLIDKKKAKEELINNKKIEEQERQKQNEMIKLEKEKLEREKEMKKKEFEKNQKRLKEIYEQQVEEKRRKDEELAKQLKEKEKEKVRLEKELERQNLEEEQKRKELEKKEKYEEEQRGFDEIIRRRELENRIRIENLEKKIKEQEEIAKRERKFIKMEFEKRNKINKDKINLFRRESMENHLDSKAYREQPELFTPIKAQEDYQKFLAKNGINYQIVVHPKANENIKPIFQEIKQYKIRIQEIDMKKNNKVEKIEVDQRGEPMLIEPREDFINKRPASVEKQFQSPTNPGFLNEMSKNINANDNINVQRRPSSFLKKEQLADKTVGQNYLFAANQQGDPSSLNLQTFIKRAPSAEKKPISNERHFESFLNIKKKASDDINKNLEKIFNEITYIPRNERHYENDQGNHNLQFGKIGELNKFVKHNNIFNKNEEQIKEINPVLQNLKTFINKKAEKFNEQVNQKDFVGQLNNQRFDFAKIKDMNFLKQQSPKEMFFPINQNQQANPLNKDRNLFKQE